MSTKYLNLSTYFGLGHYCMIAKLQKFYHTSTCQDSSTDRQMVEQNNFPRKVTTIAVCHRINDFFLQPPRSPFKKLFLGTKLREQLRVMSFVKFLPKGLKWIECERGIGGKNFPMRYIPEQDPTQDALEKI